MKGKFYASGDLKQLESTLKEHEPYAVLVVSTTGIDKENEFEGHFPTRVVMKQFEFDDETKSYQSGFTFDKLVQAPQEAIQEALKNESSYDVFANGGNLCGSGIQCYSHHQQSNSCVSLHGQNPVS